MAGVIADQSPSINRNRDRGGRESVCFRLDHFCLFIKRSQYLVYHDAVIDQAFQSDINHIS